MEQSETLQTKCLRALVLCSERHRPRRCLATEVRERWRRRVQANRFRSGFSLPHRRDLFADATEIAAWMASRQRRDR